jgi:hypothetical protein
VAQYPVITAGTRITDSLLSSMIPQYVIKPADTTRASTVTPTSDPDLVTGTLSAGGVYAVEFHLRFASLQAAGIRTQWAVPSGTTGNRDTLGPAATNAANANDGVVLDMRWAVFNYVTAVVYTDPRNSVTLQAPIIEKAIVSIGGTAGTVALQWAQNVTNATGTVVNAVSYVRWQQVG